MTDGPAQNEHRIFVGSVGRLLREAAGAYAADRLGLAEEMLRQIVELRPAEHAAWRLRALNAARGNRHEAALQFLGRAIALAPETARYRADLGALLSRMGQHEAACEAFGQAGKDTPLPVGHRFLHANSLFACDRIGDAVEAYETARAQRPDDPDILNNLALALMAAGRMDDAAHHLRNALALQPDHPDVLLNLGNLHRMAGGSEAAAACYRDALHRRPRDFRIYGNLGLALLNQDRPEDAIALYEKALVLAPEHPQITTSLGIAQLLTGNLAEGWRNYEARWQAGPATDEGAMPPRWQGESLAGRSILLQCEQGFGDSLQFCRYVPLVAARADRVAFEVPAGLARLMGSLSGDVEIVIRGRDLPQTDLRAGLLSLPRLTGAGATTLETIPSDVPYLAPQPRLAARWRRRIETAEGVRIGIAWAGNPNRQDDRMRSCPVVLLSGMPELPGISWFNLQKDMPEDAGESRAFARRLIDLAADFSDFADTAAAIQALDLVITVDTAVAHLAGALGKPVWTMLGYAADWRYLRDRQDCPWYPSMRLYRQPQPGDWAATIARIEADLETFVNG